MRYEGSWPRAVLEGAALLRLVLGPSSGRPERFYTLLSTHNLLSEHSLFMNLGYWADSGVRTLDEASRALTALLGQTARLGPGDEVLDVGFGFGDQILYWAGSFHPRRLTGLDLMPLHVEVARERMVRAGLASRVLLQEGSATRMPFPARCFDKVVALESSFHFDTREDFFTEAWRVLRPGGRLALTDILPLPGHRFSRLFQAVWQIPGENLYCREIYRARLVAAGFEAVEVHSIREHVYEPLLRFLGRRLDAPELVHRMNPLLRLVSRPWWYARLVRSTFDYVLATGVKPLR
ncbi:McyJ [Cystobacter fuscus DSM 2262]|uniref:McyJ n=1 Tax=Cystobacter fuscus (strain ATCC 25194 / DSM 2262 / NBRC 100088 / M29) TaxID=1242864 RepID=S9P4Q0_CYSF2|nr:class I SAM-dependent methyltransferase [Cystobacter fuscus]EPX57192.1 McyJ [Cystobacter fuscus DSM 2262]